MGCLLLVGETGRTRVGGLGAGNKLHGEGDFLAGIAALLFTCIILEGSSTKKNFASNLIFWVDFHYTTGLQSLQITTTGQLRTIYEMYVTHVTDQQTNVITI